VLNEKGQRWLALAFGEGWVSLSTSAATAACTTAAEATASAATD